MTTDTDRKARILFMAVLAFGLVTGAIAYYFSSARYVTYEIRTRDPVSGLIPDAPVEFHGVEVGKVKSVELVGPDSVRVLIGVRDTAPVTAATVATITSRGLATRGFTGYVYVSLEDEGSDLRPVAVASGHEHPVIPARASKSSNLDVAISELNENVQALTGVVLTLLDAQTVASIKKSADGLERATRRVQPLLDTSHDTVKALQNQLLPETHRLITDLDRLSTTLAGVADKIERDPSVVIRGARPPAPGPGEQRRK